MGLEPESAPVSQPAEAGAGSASSSPHAPRRSLAQVLSSRTSSVLLGAVVTAVLGNWVIGLVQDRNKTRELAREAYKQHLAAQAQVIERTYNLIGRVIATSEDLLDITAPEFSPLYFRGKERERVIAQKTKVREQFNEVNQEWRREKQSLGFLVSYYHDGLPDLATLWRDVVSKLDTYSECAENEYRRTLTSNSADRAARPCQESRKAFETVMDRMNVALLDARRYAWQEMGFRARHSP